MQTFPRKLERVRVKVAQSSWTFYDPIDIAHGVFQARILEWVAFPFSRGILNPGIEPRSPALHWILYQLSHNGSPKILEWIAYPFSRGSS